MKETNGCKEGLYRKMHLFSIGKISRKKTEKPHFLSEEMRTLS